MRSLNSTLFLTVVVALLMAAGAKAGEAIPAGSALSILSTVSSAELPAKAGELVAKASDAKNQGKVTADVVKAAVGLNPAAAPAIVGGIAQASPAMAATASAAAAVLVPDQVLAIARAAATACPAKAGAIVEALCHVFPADYQKIAEAVAGVAPGAAKEILAGVTTAIPSLKPAIDQSAAQYSGSSLSVSAVLTQAAQTASAPATVIAAAAVTPIAATPAAPSAPVYLPRGPSFGPPLVSPTTTPTGINPGSGGEVPPGGRGYSSP